MRYSLYPRLQILAAALLFSTGGMAIKSCGLPDWQIAGFRCGLAAVVMVLLLPEARRLPGREAWTVGVAYAATLILYVLANKATTTSNAIFLQATAMIYVVLLSPRLLGERIRKADLLLLAPMIAGLVLLLFGEVEPTNVAPDPWRGNVLGVLAGLSWAATLLGLRYLSRGGGSEGAGAVVAGNVLAFAGALPMAWPLVAGSATDWMWLGYLGFFQVALAYVLLLSGMRQVPAFEAVLLILIEPVFAPFWSWFVHGEAIGGQALLGAVLIFLVMVLKPWLELRRGGIARKRETNAASAEAR